MIFNFLGWANIPLYGNLNVPKTKIVDKLFKISQNGPIIVNFLIFFLVGCDLNQN